MSPDSIPSFCSNSLARARHHYFLVRHESGEKLLYTVEEAVELLSISRAQIYRLMETIEIESITIGRSRRITHSQLVSFIERRETAARSLPERLNSCKLSSVSRRYTNGQQSR
jgi:excisionase family DNA binding protein